MNIVFVPFDTVDDLLARMSRKVKLDGTREMEGTLEVTDPDSPGNFPEDVYFVTRDQAVLMVTQAVPNTSDLVRLDGSVSLGDQVVFSDEMSNTSTPNGMVTLAFTNNLLNQALQQSPIMDGIRLIGGDYTGSNDKKIFVTESPVYEGDVYRYGDLRDAYNNMLFGAPYVNEQLFTYSRRLFLPDPSLPDATPLQTNHIAHKGYLDGRINEMGLDLSLWVRKDGSTPMTGAYVTIEDKYRTFDFLTISNLLMEAQKRVSEVPVGTVIQKITDDREPHPSRLIPLSDGIASKAMYPELYDVIGESCNPNNYLLGPNGKPWCQQFEINDHIDHEEGVFISFPPVDSQNSGTVGFNYQPWDIAYPEAPNYQEGINRPGGDENLRNRVFSLTGYYKGVRFDMGGYGLVSLPLSINGIPDQATIDAYPEWVNDVLPLALDRYKTYQYQSTQEYSSPGPGSWGGSFDIWRQNFTDMRLFKNATNEGSIFPRPNSIGGQPWEHVVHRIFSGTDDPDSTTIRHVFAGQILHYGGRLISAGGWVLGSGYESNSVVTSIAEPASIDQNPYPDTTIHRSYIPNTSGADQLAWNRTSWSDALIIGGKLYLFGGISTAFSTSSPAVRSVIYCPINENGSFGTWATGPSLPVAMDSFNLILTSNALYLIGGFLSARNRNVEGQGSISVPAANLNIYRCNIRNKALVGPWQVVGTLPETPYGVGSVAQRYHRASASIVVTKRRWYWLFGAAYDYTFPNDNSTLPGMPFVVNDNTVVSGKIHSNGVPDFDNISLSILTLPSGQGSHSARRSEATVGDGRLFIGDDGGRLISIPFPGGLDDYSYYSRTGYPNPPPSMFHLPHSTEYDRITGLHSFIVTK